jgi:hypothetical protein
MRPWKNFYGYKKKTFLMTYIELEGFAAGKRQNKQKQNGILTCGVILRGI